MMAKNNIRLDSYFANVSARRRGVTDWRIYAAVTGSAMAMATNASAGVIYFNQAVSVGPVANVVWGGFLPQHQNIALKSAMGGSIGASFAVALTQRSFSGAGMIGAAIFRGVTPNISVLVTSSFMVKKLASGANISTASGQWAGGAKFAAQRSSHTGSGWNTNSPGLAGFRFSTTNHTVDYGWVRLSYTLGTNGLTNSVTAVDWGYDPTGAPVTAGEVGSSTPEPSTTALAILAAGAAGVAALRRRRVAAGENL